MRTRFIGGAMLLFALVLPFQGLTQAAAPDPHPLLPADTSSPRATLRSFLTNTTKAIEERRRAASNIASIRSFLRALETLDFSTTPDGDSWTVRIQRALLLKEVLDRIKLPPEDEIPGDANVADSAITEWTIPDTSIRIERIEHGPRVGEFLFSSDTVEMLERLYRRAKHLPYQPGASIGRYKDWTRSERTAAAYERELWNRLKPVDTSNPRSTLEGFLDSINRAYVLVMEAKAALKATPPTMTKAEAREIEITAINLLERATATLDLSRVPRALREDVGVETALQLKEIFDRMLLPPLDSVPDAQMVTAAWKQASELSRTAEPVRWRFPNTEIEIVEIMDGERQGQFLFSASTVSRTRGFYREIRDLPYRLDVYENVTRDYLSSGISKGFYEDYVSTPGYLVPRLHFLGTLVDPLPGSFNAVYGEQMIWQWIGLFLSVLAVALAVYLVYRVLKRVAGRLGSPMDRWLMILVPIIVAGIVKVVIDFINEGLSLTGNVGATLRTGSAAIVFAMAAWAIFEFCRAVAETIVASPRIPEKSIDASLLRIGARIVGFLIGAWIFVGGIRDLGADVIPLLAGLGVGGLAVALAAQKPIANFIGSLILFANKPVRVGDFCRYGDEIGTIEEIGLISTRIRSLERTIVTVPNAEFSEMKLDNFTKRDQRLLKTVLQLRYETTPEQMRYVLAKVRELLLGHPKVTPAPARARYVGYGAYSKDIEIFAYLRCQDQDTFLTIQEDILLRIEDIITEAGTGFAVPSQTAYLTRDKGLAEDRVREAETHVATWREEGRLPFPEFDEALRGDMEDTLDYPPAGSPHYTPRDRVSDAPLPSDSPPVRKPTWKRAWLKKD